MKGRILLTLLLLQLVSGHETKCNSQMQTIINACREGVHKVLAVAVNNSKLQSYWNFVETQVCHFDLTKFSKNSQELLNILMNKFVSIPKQQQIKEVILKVEKEVEGGLETTCNPPTNSNDGRRQKYLVKRDQYSALKVSISTMVSILVVAIAIMGDAAVKLVMADSSYLGLMPKGKYVCEILGISTLGAIFASFYIIGAYHDFNEWIVRQRQDSEEIKFPEDRV